MHKNVHQSPVQTHRQWTLDTSPEARERTMDGPNKEMQKFWEKERACIEICVGIFTDSRFISKLWMHPSSLSMNWSGRNFHNAVETDTSLLLLTWKHSLIQRIERKAEKINAVKEDPTKKNLISSLKGVFYTANKTCLHTIMCLSASISM